MSSQPIGYQEGGQWAEEIDQWQMVLYCSNILVNGREILMDVRSVEGVKPSFILKTEKWVQAVVVLGQYLLEN